MYWQENQAVITFHSDTRLPSDPQLADIASIIESLRLDALNLFLNARGLNLKSFTEKDVLRPVNKQIGKDGEGTYHQPGSHPSDQKHVHLNSPIGKYLFASPSQGAIVVCFFHIEPHKIPHPPQGMMSMHGSREAHVEASMTSEVVNLINRNLDKLRHDGKIPIVAAMPNWLGGATGCIAHGCPVVPPIPVPAETHGGGLWSIELPDLNLSSPHSSSPIRNMRGEGVTVFVLDSMPNIEREPDRIAEAGKNNLLLNKIAAQKDRSQSPFIKFFYQHLPATLLENAEDQIVTGRDIYGRLYGFHMPDHGLFITGIARDLAPEANIEYIRVLNDFGVGDTSTLVAALAGIQARMLKGKDLYQQPVVINLSLVITHADEELAGLWFGDDSPGGAEEFTARMQEIRQLRAGLHLVIQSLTAMGAIIVASAGNDSSVHQWVGHLMADMGMAQRWGPRYPAAFPEVISVGALDKDGKAAPYSDYPVLPPDHHGIATYGGSVPTPIPPSNSNPMTEAKDIDALHGVYSSKTYPALAANDPQPDRDAPSSNAWAYWSGTSFATPIISALAARVLEKAKLSNLPSHLWTTQVQWAITNADGQQEMLTGTNPLPLQPEFSLEGGVSVGMLRAYQREGEAEV